MKKRYLDFICTIGELSSLFTESSTLDSFLQNTVDIVARHMEVDVCSIYLYDQEAGLLVLQATHGLAPGSAGRVRLAPGEGIVGLAMKERRPLLVGDSAAHPAYKHIPGIGEERYASFLALPMLRGDDCRGVVVVQHAEKDFFSAEDLKALKIINSQLASAVENARLFLRLRENRQQPVVREEQPAIPAFVKGKVGAEGLACGRALVDDKLGIHEYLDKEFAEDGLGLAAFRTALQTTARQLEGFQQGLEEKLADIGALIFSAHLLMLKDRNYSEKIEARITAGTHPGRAIAEVTHEFMHLFQTMADPYMQEKAVDIEDLGKRLIENLLFEEGEKIDYEGRIIIARNLYPSDIIRYFSEGIAGIVSIGGGVASHVSILARSLELPLVITDVMALRNLAPGTRILLDAQVGTVYVDPDRTVLDSYQDKFRPQPRFKPLEEGGARTRDGVPVLLQANINLLRDVDYALGLNAGGVGLYRSEFPFLVRSDFPTEEEQYLVYAALMEKMAGRPVTIRTLDVGGDKIPSYYQYGAEQNPFLGMRSIRFSLREPVIFRQQLRAILRAGAGSDLGIMFPMISSLDEYRQAEELVGTCAAELAEEGAEFNRRPRLGMMIELPAALEILDELAGACDFFSIGTNDLVQYMLAVDRTNENVSHLYLQHHPAVLRALKRIVAAGARAGIPVSVCGDMGRDEKFIDFFLGIGVRSFSVDPHFLPFMRDSINAIRTREAEAIAARLLQCATISEAEAIIASGDETT